MLLLASNLWEVECFRRLIASLSSLSPCPIQAHLCDFVLDELAPGHNSVPSTAVFPFQHHSVNGPCAFIHQRPKLDFKPIFVGFVLDDVALTYVFMEYFVFLPLSIIPPMRYTHLSVIDVIRCYNRQSLLNDTRKTLKICLLLPLALH
jgi:hypothetical protein